MHKSDSRIAFVKLRVADAICSLKAQLACATSQLEQGLPKHPQLAPGVEYPGTNKPNARLIRHAFTTRTSERAPICLKGPIMRQTNEQSKLLLAKHVESALKKVARPDKAAFMPKFFQATPGGYGEGDKFIGCVVPDQRKIAKQFRDLSRVELLKLFDSAWHECRLTGMLILVDQFERAAKPKNANRLSASRDIVDFYITSIDAANNWDIVDSTAPKLLGAWLLENPTERKMLNELAASDSVWKRRVAVVTTYPLIRSGELTEIRRLAERLMDDPHELIHKAIGWMLREMGKQDQSTLEQFLTNHAHQMPRFMLRYSIEKLSEPERHFWLQSRGG
jgi:3-methyladenine DNA glycosylase AlkD